LLYNFFSFLDSSAAEMNKNRTKGQRGGAWAPPPAMHIHQPHFAEVVSVSANGCRGTARAHVVNTEPSIPDYVQEDAATNAAIENWEFSYDLGDTALVGEVQAPEDDGIVLRSKKQVYENSVCVNEIRWCHKF
jgi:hypothetical protein